MISLRNNTSYVLPSLIIIATLSACSAGPDQNESASSNDLPVSADRLPPDTAQISPEKDVQKGRSTDVPFNLMDLTQTDLNSVKLNGELGCSFTEDNSAQPILVAQGDVASDKPARGIIRLGNAIEKIAAGGGFNAMSKGTAFTGKGFELRISLTGPATGGGESPLRPATLTVSRSDGVESIYDGRWQCGP